MSANDLKIQTQNPSLRSATGQVTWNQPTTRDVRSNFSNGLEPTATFTPRAGRLRWTSILGGLTVVLLLPVLAGCGSDEDNPSVPTSLAPAAGTAPAGAGVPLEPGSNLPPVEGDDETITTSTG